MVLHLGMDYILPKKDIFFIFKYDKGFREANEAVFLNLEKNSQIVYIGKKKLENIKSVVYGNFLGRKYIFYSPISASTLVKRMKETAK
ncbi:MAG: DUF370 domain-containing protein [Eubacteriales bacterium]